jgi:hypothetical protein
MTRWARNSFVVLSNLRGRPYGLVKSGHETEVGLDGDGLTDGERAVLPSAACLTRPAGDFDDGMTAPPLRFYSLHIDWRGRRERVVG